MRKKIIILGGGLAGLSLAYFLKEKGHNSILFEKDERCGGLCRSTKMGGFTFDVGGHFLHFRSRDTFRFVKRLLEGKLTKHKRSAWVYAFNRFIPYPFQVNLSQLPKPIEEECLLGFIEAHTNGRQHKNAPNLREWSKNNLGEGITKHFMVPYNEKFWKMPLEELTSSWAERFIVRPSFRDIVKGTLGRKTRDLGYHSFFWYPEKGGIEEFINALSARLKNIFINQEVVRIDLKRKRVRFKGGREETYDTLISTVPLPVLGKAIHGLPQDLLKSFRKLKWLSIYNINLGIDRRIAKGKHWIYFPDKNIRFFRIGFSHNVSRHLAPRDKGSLYVEISYPKGKSINKRDVVTKIKKDLVRTGIFDKDTQINCKNINDIRYAYPVYDNNYLSARKKIFKFLSKHNIVSCGRFGSWRYLSMEDTIIESKRIANEVVHGAKAKN